MLFLDSKALACFPSINDSAFIDLWDLSSCQLACSNIGRSDLKTGMCFTCHLMSVENFIIMICGYDDGYIRVYNVDCSGFNQVFEYRVFQSSSIEALFTC